MQCELEVDPLLCPRERCNPALDACVPDAPDAAFGTCQQLGADTADEIIEPDETALSGCQGDESCPSGHWCRPVKKDHAVCDSTAECVPFALEGELCEADGECGTNVHINNCENESEDPSVPAVDAGGPGARVDQSYGRWRAPTAATPRYGRDMAEI